LKLVFDFLFDIDCRDVVSIAIGQLIVIQHVIKGLLLFLFMLLQVLRLSLLNASKDNFFQELVKNGGQLSDEVISKTVDKMFVLFGCEILKIVPGNLN
jgi:hypothetical protein